MELDTLSTFIGISIPLITIAGSAIAYVMQIYANARKEQRAQFFDLMSLIDGPGTIATKLAAVYQLRQFPEHKDFIIRFCSEQQENITGGSADYLKAEMQRTIDYYRG